MSERIVLWGMAMYAAGLPLMQSPYAPFLGSPLGSGRIQLVDLIPLLISPFAAILVMKNRGAALRPFRSVLVAVVLYLVLLLASDSGFSTIGFEFMSGVLLASVFVLVLLIAGDARRLNVILGGALVGVLLTLTLSWIGILAYYALGFRWPYILQENHVFPYVGDVVRLTGPFKPTAKLLSSYLTIVVPAMIAVATIVKSTRLRWLLGGSALASIALFPLTMSRGVVGFAFAISVAVYHVARGRAYLIALARLGFAATAVLLVVVATASTIYVVDHELSYRYDSDPSHPHTVYHYFHPQRGKEEVVLRLGFSRDHYYWLRAAAVEIVRRHPWGVGNGNYALAVRDLEESGVIPVGLSRHPTPQGEFFYAAAERGWLGVASLALMFGSWVAFLVVRRAKDDPVLTAAAASLLALCFVDAFYLEITRFRFLWFFAAVAIAYAHVASTDRRGVGVSCA